MGYYTYYDLSTRENKYKVSDIVRYMKDNFLRHDGFYAFEHDFDDFLNDESTIDFELDGGKYKWYDYHEEMIELSKQFPRTVFCLHGDGEMNDDMWYQYYKNGKSQYCPAQIIFDEYDESKLISD